MSEKSNSLGLLGIARIQNEFAVTVNSSNEEFLFLFCKILIITSFPSAGARNNKEGKHTHGTNRSSHTHIYIYVNSVVHGMKAGLINRRSLMAFASCVNASRTANLTLASLHAHSQGKIKCTRTPPGNYLRQKTKRKYENK